MSYLSFSAWFLLLSLEISLCLGNLKEDEALDLEGLPILPPLALDGGMVSEKSKV